MKHFWIGGDETTSLYVTDSDPSVWNVAHRVDERRTYDRAAYTDMCRKMFDLIYARRANGIDWRQWEFYLE